MGIAAVVLYIARENNQIYVAVFAILIVVGAIAFLLIAPLIVSLIVAFARSGEPGQWPVQLGLLVLGLVLIGMLAKSKWLDRTMCGSIRWALRRWTEFEVRDYASRVD